jgi:hypothetical protein
MCCVPIAALVSTAAANLAWCVPKINHWDYVHLSKHWFLPIKLLTFLPNHHQAGPWRHDDEKKWKERNHGAKVANMV